MALNPLPARFSFSSPTISRSWPLQAKCKSPAIRLSGADIYKLQTSTRILKMPVTLPQTVPFFPLIFCSFLIPLTYSCTFTITNNCPYTIWPGTLAGAGTPQLASTGFRLDSGHSMRIPSDPGWSGRIWARTGCTFDESGNGTCQTGDCGGRLECNGSGATPPASLFEITLGTGNVKDYYDVSLVDGYNLPLVAAPVGVHGACNATGCVSDINTGCPKELQVVGDDGGEGGVVACKSACEAFALDQYCCGGEFANPTTCQPSFYSTIFKRACPRAYSYAFDDGTSTFTCKAYDYAIVFCPTADGIKAPDGAHTDTLIPNPGNGETMKLVSSSNILQPLPLLFLLLILYLTLRTSMESYTPCQDGAIPQNTFLPVSER